MSESRDRETFPDWKRAYFHRIVPNYPDPPGEPVLPDTLSQEERLAIMLASSNAYHRWRNARNKAIRAIDWNSENALAYKAGWDDATKYHKEGILSYVEGNFK